MEQKDVLKPIENEKPWLFKPGGKPGPGRPKGSNHVTICKKFMEDKGWDILFTLAEDKDKKIKFEATKLLLSYGFGKPPETINAQINQPEPFEEFTVTELEELKKFHGSNRQDRLGACSEMGGTEIGVLPTEPGATKVD